MLLNGKAMIGFCYLYGCAAIIVGFEHSSSEVRTLIYLVKIHYFTGLILFDKMGDHTCPSTSLMGSHHIGA